MLENEKKSKPNLKGEMDELQRASQDLSRDHGIDVSVNDLVKAFNSSTEETISKDIWEKLQNTESNTIEKGDFKAVEEIAKKYDKTSPKILAKALKSGKYNRPLIINIGDNYILVAGNTRLCTAAAMGIKPKVFIGEIGKQTNESELLKGGNADNKSLIYIAKKHDAKGYYHIDNMIQSLKKQVEIGIPIEMEHTDDKNKAKEIVMDHLWEDPTYYTKLRKMEKKDTTENIDKDLKGNQKDMVYGIVNIVKKVVDMDNRRKIADDMIKQFKRENIDFDYDEFLTMCGCNKKVEAKEMTGADSAGAFSAPAFGGKKTVVNKIHNMKEEEELDEITDASSSGSYDVPLFGGPKGRKNPLSIGGPDSIYKGRAVKDKKFPKWGGPGGKFVKIKDKCKKYPYCTQGDMSAIELLETEEIKTAIEETSKKYGISIKEVNNLVLNQIKEIFI